jgi:hypothetical protein
MCGENLFDFTRPHLIAARLDQILLAVDDEQERVLVDVSQISV